MSKVTTEEQNVLFRNYDALSAFVDFYPSVTRAEIITFNGVVSLTETDGFLSIQNVQTAVKFEHFIKDLKEDEKLFSDFLISLMFFDFFGVAISVQNSLNSMPKDEEKVKKNIKQLAKMSDRSIPALGVTLETKTGSIFLENWRNRVQVSNIQTLIPIEEFRTILRETNAIELLANAIASSELNQNSSLEHLANIPDTYKLIEYFASNGVIKREFDKQAELLSKNIEIDELRKMVEEMSLSTQDIGEIQAKIQKHG